MIGTRVAGATTAMLLARRGLKVLAVDRAAFPSDTLSTHQVQLPGIARLARWGLLDRVIASNAPPTHAVRFDPGRAVLHGPFPPGEGIDALYSPRRTVLDAILVAAAREAGAEWSSTSGSTRCSGTATGSPACRDKPATARAAP